MMTREVSGGFRDVGLPVEADRESDDIDLLGTLRALWRGRYWLLAAAVLGWGIGWYLANVRAVPVYTARAVVAMETRDENVVDLGNVVTALPGTLGTINTELGVLRSRGLIEKVVLALDLAGDPAFNPYLRAITDGRAPTEAEKAEAEAQALADTRVMDLLIDGVLGRLSVSNDQESYLFNISVTTTEPERSAEIANTLAAAYIDDQIEVKFHATEQATAWLTDRLNTLQGELEAAESAVEAFASENRMVRAEDLEALNLRINDARERLDAVRKDGAALVERRARLADAEAAGDWPAVVAAADDQQLRAALIEGAETPAFTARLEAVRARLAVELGRAEAQSATLARSVAVLDEDYAQASDDLVTYQQLGREVEASRAIYEYFLGRMKELTASEGNLRADSRIISRAAVPRWPSAPNKSRIMSLSLAMALIAGAGGVLLWDMLRTGFRTGAEVEAATGRSVMGQIPLVPRSERGEVLTYFVDKPTSMAAEAVRNLRTSVLMSNLDRPPKVVMLTSSLPGEGKTTTSIALAQNFTGLGRKVLLIEGDIRHRVFRDYLDLKKTKGLLSVLSGEVELAQAVERNYLIDADVLVGERAAMNAADVFSSSRFKALVAEAKSRYDVVIIDTPPVLVVPDARVVAQFADAVLYVVEWNRTTRRDVATGLKMMADGGIRVSGLVLARIDMKKLKRMGQYAGYGTYAAQKKYGKSYYEG